ncbi:MAG: hypothetical protein AB7N76_30015 [Planctomycetota bacterium]
MDAHLRELERRAELGDVSDRARLLAERVRVGVLEGESLELAATLGDPAACRALDRAQPADRFDALAATLPAPWQVRLLAAAVELCLPSLEAWLPLEEGPARALEALAAWFERPGEAEALEAQEAGAGAVAREAAGRVTYQLLPRYEVAMLGRAEITALEYVAWTAHDAAEGPLRCLEGRGPELASALRLADARAEAGWEAPGALCRRAGRRAARWVLGGAA